MIIAKTPLKLPFAGGLTDIKDYAARFGGVTVSTTIDKYVYVALKDNLGGYFRLRYQDVQEKVADVEHIKNDLIRESIQMTGLAETPLDIVIMADLAGESGLGSSGAVTVTLLHAMHAFQGKTVSKAQLYREASQIEVEILAGASGYHDPAICALGGLKRIDYQGPDIHYRDIAVSSETLTLFQESLLFFYGGRHHKSKPSLSLLSSHLEEALDILHDIKETAVRLEQALEAGDLPGVASCIGMMQAQKQQLPGQFVDDYVLRVTELIRQQGAYAQLPGGKISAFVMVCCPEGAAQREAVRRVMTDHKEIKLCFETLGTQVVSL